MKDGLRLRAAGVGVLAVGVACALTVAVVLFRVKTDPLESPAMTPQCGHWCVLRCCEVLGAPVDMSAIVDLLPYHKGGHSMLQLAEALEEIGLDAEGRQETLETLGSARFPCIAHLRDPDHFVVLLGVEDERVHVFDGFGRRISRSAQAFSKKWSGTALFVRRRPHGDALPALIPQAKRPAPSIQFDTLLIDKGTVPAVGKPTVFVYPFQNLGSADLVIEDVKPDCKCIGFTKPEGPIPPGGPGSVELSYNVKAKEGPFCHEVAVKTNDPRVPIVLLKASGYTGVEISVYPPRLDLGEIVCDRPHSAVCFVKNTGDWTDFEVEEVTSSLEGVKLSDYRCSSIGQVLARRLWPDAPEEFSGGDHAKIIELSFSPAKRPGGIEGTIRIRTNIREYEQFSIRVAGRVVTQVASRPSVLFFGEVLPDEEVHQSVTLVSMVDEAFEILSVEPTSADLLCTFPKSAAKETEIGISGTGAAALRFAGKDLQVRVKLAESGDEVSIPLRASAWVASRVQR